MPERQVEQAQAEDVRSPRWEATPWIAEERVVEEPRRAAEPPLLLADEHVVDASLAGESGSIVLAG